MKDHISNNLDGFDFSVPLATKQDLHHFLLNAIVTQTLHECYRHATEYQRLAQKKMKPQSDFYPYRVGGLRWLLAFAGLQKTEDGRSEDLSLAPSGTKNKDKNKTSRSKRPPVEWSPIVSRELKNTIDHEIR